MEALRGAQGPDADLARKIAVSALLAPSPGWLGAARHAGLGFVSGALQEAALRDIEVADRRRREPRAPKLLGMGRTSLGEAALCDLDSRMGR